MTCVNLHAGSFMQLPRLTSESTRYYSSLGVASSTSPFSIARLNLRRSKCNSWRTTRQASDNSGYCRVVSASASLVVTESGTGKDVEEEKKADVELLACPLCYQPLLRKGTVGLSQRAIGRSGFECVSCKKSYSSRDVYLDLTLTANSKVYEEVSKASMEMFRSPLVSFVYERGWRQNFGMSGFPGPDEEVKMAEEFLKPTFGGVLLDVSCGSGLFTRRFAKLDLYSSIVAIDYSENMLRQTYEFIKQDQTLVDKSIALVRADVARMPFATGTIDAVHAGAALHCWPSPAAGVAEISRILRPGGVFVATTFLLTPGFSLATPGLSEIRKALIRNPAGVRLWDEKELEELTELCGLVNYQKIQRQNFIMITAQKPK